MTIRPGGISRRLLIVLGTAISGGCVHAPLNAPLTGAAMERRVDYIPRTPAESDGLAVLLFFSGGGTRAAALSYGVLKELAATRVPASGPPRRLLDDVELISAVSGGSFTAAYYCLNHDRIFQDFEPRFLKQDIQGALIRRWLSPLSWPRLASPYFGRSDLAAEYYDRQLFDHAVYGDLLKSGGRPFLVLNATDMAEGEQFPFARTQFDLISSNLDSYPIARAVAASSAFPVLLTPITLRNYPAGPAARSELAEKAAALAATTHVERQTQQVLLSYSAKDRPYIHLVDGGVSDNLGLQSAEDVFLISGGMAHFFQTVHLQPMKLAVIVVDAATHRGAEWNTREAIPGIASAFAQMTDQLGDRMDYLTLDAMREALTRWRRELTEPARNRTGRPEFYFMTVSFSDLQDDQEKHFFENLPTNFHLSPSTVDRVVAVAGSLLRSSPEFKRLTKDLAEDSTPVAAPQPSP